VDNFRPATSYACKFDRQEVVSVGLGFGLGYQVLSVLAEGAPTQWMILENVEERRRGGGGWGRITFFAKNTTQRHKKYECNS